MKILGKTLQHPPAVIPAKAGIHVLIATVLKMFWSSFLHINPRLRGDDGRSKICLATMYGVGLVKFAPGTAGSIVAALLAWGIFQLPYGWAILAVGTILFTILGTRSATRYMAEHNTAHDPSEIVIDELVGQWLTYLVFAAAINTYFHLHQFSGIVSLLHGSILINIFLIGFISFRIFDILKPWPISWVDKNIHGGWGVMADDLVAAIPAGVLLCAIISYAIFMGTP
jgi:phosphatidylglycerophosphatase A